MARRMKYSVVGLPHYTIWHLYEPSVDDVKHMEVSANILPFSYLPSMFSSSQQALTSPTGNGTRADRA